MALTTREILKTYFQTGKYPTEAQFAALIDSMRHKDDQIGIAYVTGLADALNALNQALAGKQSTLTFDGTPTSGSGNPVTSAGIKSVIDSLSAELLNYYLKSETYSKSEVNALFAAIRQSYEVVSVLPTASAETMYRIYLVPSQNAQEQNVKDEYITIATTENDVTTYDWEQIGSTTVDLSGYPTTGQLTDLLAGKQDTLTFDNTPTANSRNPVTSAGIRLAIDLHRALSAQMGELEPISSHVIARDYYTKEQIDEFFNRVLVADYTPVVIAWNGAAPWPTNTAESFTYRYLTDSGGTSSRTYSGYRFYRMVDGVKTYTIPLKEGQTIVVSGHTDYRGATLYMNIIRNNYVSISRSCDIPNGDSLLSAYGSATAAMPLRNMAINRNLGYHNDLGKTNPGSFIPNLLSYTAVLDCEISIYLSNDYYNPRGYDYATDKCYVQIYEAEYKDSQLPVEPTVPKAEEYSINLANYGIYHVTTDPTVTHTQKVNYATVSLERGDILTVITEGVGIVSNSTVPVITIVDGAVTPSESGRSYTANEYRSVYLVYQHGEDESRPIDVRYTITKTRPSLRWLVDNFNARIKDVEDTIGSLPGYMTIAQVQALLAGKQDALTFDEIPTAGSRNPVTSEGVEAYLDARGFHGENLGTVTINQNTYGRSSFHKTINGITYHCAQLNAPSGNWEDGDHLVLSVTRNSGDSAQPLYIISHNFIMAPEGTIVSTGFTGTTIHYTVELSQLLVTQLLALGVPEGSSSGSANIVVNGKVYHKTVHTADIADGAVTAAKISDGSVTSAKIGTGAVTTPKISDNAVTMAKLAASVRGYFLSEESLMPLLREQAWSLASEETAMYGTGGGFVYVATILSQDLDFPYCKKTLSLRKGQALRITSDRSDYLLGAVVFEDVLAEAEEGVLEYVADDDISVNIITPVDYDDVVNGEYIRTSEEIDRFDNPTESFTIAIYDTVKSLSARLAALEANV